MTKTFNIGDTVKRTSSYGGSLSVLAVGATATVTATADDEGLLTVRTAAGQTIQLYPSRFELVSPAPVPGPIDLSALKKGDKVTFTITAEVLDGPDFEGDVSIKFPGGETRYLWRRETYIGTVEKAVKSFKVGDRVNVLLARAGGTIVADRQRTILAIYGNEALLDVDGSFSEKRPLTRIVHAD